MELAFSKATATGNDFVFFDARAARFSDDLSQVMGSIHRDEIARRLCDRNFGIGADGVVFLENSEGHTDFKWDFYNSDGSTAEMCGNAARACAAFARSVGFMADRLRLATKAGVVECVWMGPQMIEVSMPTPHILKKSFRFANGSTGDLINTGVPHVVIEVSQLHDIDVLAEAARELRHDPATGAAGANVTFRQPIAEDQLKSMTFERGVEDFTLSCGTGAVAAALSQGLKKAERHHFKVMVPGGVVEVHLTPGRDGARLLGPAQILFTGQIRPGWIP